MLVRGDGLSATMSKYLIDEISRTSNIVVEARTQVLEAIGNERLESLRLRGPAGNLRCRRALAVCLHRRSARHGLASDVHSARRKGFILSGPDCARMASCRGVARNPRAVSCSRPAFPAFLLPAMCAHGSIKRVASAVGEGSIAVQFVHQYLAGFVGRS
jgi:thioredoxin reductase (NADPH)